MFYFGGLALFLDAGYELNWSGAEENVRKCLENVGKWEIKSGPTLRFGVWVWSTMNRIKMLNCWSYGNESLRKPGGKEENNNNRLQYRNTVHC